MKENKTLKQIKTKLIDNNALITKADKGKTVVVIDRDEYTSKVNAVSYTHLDVYKRQHVHSSPTNILTCLMRRRN